jgi:hypothetical protein
VRIAHAIRVEYAVLPPDSQLLAQARQQATIEGRRLTDMQGFYVYRGNRLVCFASWLNLPGVGGGRWNKESSTQLARIAVDLTNTSDEEWALDVRKSHVSPPDLVRPVLVEVGMEARALSRARIFGRGRSTSGEPRPDEPLPSLWSLGQGRLEINRSHPLVTAVVNPGETSPTALRATIRSLLRQLEASPALVALISEPTASPAEVESPPAVFDEADFGEALDLGRCLITSGTPMRTVIEIVCEDPRYRNDPALLERLRTRLEQA